MGRAEVAVRPSRGSVRRHRRRPQMPRTAFALPLRPDRIGAWEDVARELGSDRARDHRGVLLERGIFREQVWVQTGFGSRPWSIVVWDCDDPGLRAIRCDAPTSHERWLLERFFGDLHGLTGEACDIGAADLIGGTTSIGGAAAATTTLALELRPGAEDELLGWARRIDSGDLREDHRQHLASSGVHEEWLWLQRPLDGITTCSVALLHWLCTDPSHPLRALARARTSYAAKLAALLHRLTGRTVTELAGFSTPLVSSMHVRRSDAKGQPRERLARRLATAVVAGDLPTAETLVAADVALRSGDEVVLGADAVVGELRRVLIPDGHTLEVQDVLAGRDHVMLLAGCHVTGLQVGVLLELGGRRVVNVTVLDVAEPCPDLEHDPTADATLAGPR